MTEKESLELLISMEKSGGDWNIQFPFYKIGDYLFNEYIFELDGKLVFNAWHLPTLYEILKEYDLTDFGFSDKEVVSSVSDLIGLDVDGFDSAIKDSFVKAEKVKVW